MVVIERKEKCCGCSACGQICPVNAISFVSDEEGFVYPQIDKKLCIDCGACNKVCPVNNKIKSGHLESYAFLSMDKEIRSNSSSGGFFSVIADRVLAQSGVVFGVAMNSECKEAEYVEVDNYEKLAGLRGSKYVQVGYTSAIFKKVKQRLEENKLVLFTGTPCIVNGLTNYLHKDYSNLIRMDLICHGVPSPLLWKTHVDYLENRYRQKLSNVSFRSKKRSWNNFGINTKFQKKEIYSNRWSDFYMHFFLKNYSIRPSCFECPAKQYNSADITVGDFWGVERLCPELSDGLGTSLVIIRTPKGKEIFDKIAEMANIRYLETDYQDAVSINSAELYSTNRPKERDSFFTDYNSFGYSYVVDKYLYPGPDGKIKKFLTIHGFMDLIKKLRGGGGK